MARRNLGFKCDCGHIVFASTDYFGEQVQCDGCGNFLPIPLGFYNKLPARFYPLIFLAFVTYMSYIYVGQGQYIGRSSGLAAWLLPLWIVPIAFLFCSLIPKTFMFSVYSFVMKRPFERHRGHVAALGGDDIACYVPIIAYLALIMVYARINSSGGSDSLSAVRNPWIFMMIGAGVAAGATAVVAWLAFLFAPRRLKRI